MTIEQWEPPGDMPDLARPPDKHVSILFEAELVGGHVKVRVRAATRHHSVQVDHSRGLCGELTFDPVEWLLLREALRAAPQPAAIYVKPRDSYQIIKVGGAGPGVSDHDSQQFIELKGWPNKKEPA